MPGAFIRRFDEPVVDARSLLAAKDGRSVTVCIPARDEAATVAGIVSAIRCELIEQVPLVDELVVVDDGSTDGTGPVAKEAGATVVVASETLVDHPTGPGKGQALWRGVAASTGDLVVFCDADLVGFDPGFVVGVLRPLLTIDEIALVKGVYRRPLGDDPDGGGRVNELVARPLLDLLFPQLSPVLQPLGGEYAARRDVLERLPFESGYGVELGLLIDVARRFGLGAIAQVDLGTRRHRNRPLRELTPLASAVLAAGLRRTGLQVGGDPGQLPPLVELVGKRTA